MMISVLVGGHTDLDTRVTIFSQFSGQELVQLGLEDTIGDELPLLRDLCRHFNLSCRSESSKLK